jgi:aminoglycoside phosphotransferase (APT) family kinase protein
VLEQSDMAHYLLSLGVVKPREVMDEGFTVVDASRRNRVYLATTSAGPTFVVKQASEPGAPSLATEAAILGELAREPVLAGHVPAVVVHEPGGCLVLRTPGRARDWSEHRGRFSAARARTLGRVVARLHDLPVDAPRPATPMSLLLALPPYALVAGLSFAAQDLVARVQGSDFLCGRLEELRTATCEDALVHGDLRWENCLSLPSPGSARRTRLLLADWEAAGRGDPALDAGAVLAEFLRAWVGSIPIVEPADPGRLVAQARVPLAAMRPAMAAFWDAYRAERPLPLRRVVEMTAVRLLQTAIEVAQGLAATTAHVVTLLQLADNMLRGPDVAAEQLLGLAE